MKKEIRILGLIFLFATTTVLRAQTYIEVGDAGQTLPTASGTGIVGTNLTSITGTLNSATDADLYVINITNTTLFSATASSLLGIDTSLFLFNSAGVPIIANDDSSNASFQAAIPAGNSLLTSLAPGTYYIAISLSGNEPVNLNSQQLFTVDQPTTSIRGIAVNLNPTTLSTFNGSTFVSETGDYTITLVATQAVPEPSNVILLSLGALALLGLGRLRASHS